MFDVPQFVTHYHLADRRPFLNLSDVDPESLDSVLTELETLGADGRSHRRFGPRYISLRRSTEALLREQFVARGGHPIRHSPHYFVLGESPWFRNLYDEVAEVRIPLDHLPAEATSVTWPDSIASMGLLSQYGLATACGPQYGRVFLLDELDELIATHGLPAGDPPISYDGHQHKGFEHFIEVQLWTDEPLRSLSL